METFHDARIIPLDGRPHLKQVQAKIYEYACHEGNQEPMLGILAGARASEMRR